MYLSATADICPNFIDSYFKRNIFVHMCRNEEGNGEFNVLENQKMHDHFPY